MLWTDTSDLVFNGPILSLLVENARCLAFAAVERKLEGHTFKALLSEHDRDHTGTSQQPRWWNACWWARDGMVKQGLLHEVVDSPRGSWKITELGILAVRQNRQALIDEGILEPGAQWEFTAKGQEWWKDVRAQNPRGKRWLRDYRHKHAPPRKVSRRISLTESD
jgi:Mrr N-terminal domain